MSIARRAAFLAGALVVLACLDGVAPGVVHGVAHAEDMPGVVLELRFKPAPRAQLAIWLEDQGGNLVRTFAVTEAVAYRGIGNRPGASEMNSGFRWPYGRREGVLPIWASRRAAAPGAKHWKRVIFQNRTFEGLASVTSSDYSKDNYFCLSFKQATTARDALDAVSCASVFTSDKGRFINSTDVAANYHEPWVAPGTSTGTTQALPLESLYPPRLDVTRCTDSGCYDHADVAALASHARQVMPEIDAVTTATLPGNIEQSLLFSLPTTWPSGSYALWVEVNVEGDYNATYDAITYSTPTSPNNEWDSWAVSYGYPYRGQPSVAYRVPFVIATPGETTQSASDPVGRSSWDVWDADYGKLEEPTDIADDPNNAPGSGADRLRLGADGKRLTLAVTTLQPLADPIPGLPIRPSDVPLDPPVDGMQGDSMGSGEPDGGVDAGMQESLNDPRDPSSANDDTELQDDPEGDAVILVTHERGTDGPVGAIHKLELGPHPDRLHSHEWITMSFLAPTSDQPLHRYEVRVGTEPIVDEATFIRDAKQAKTASLDAEGAVSLMLPVDGAAGGLVESEIGDLVAATNYYVAIRARDRWNRYGPISVGKITTTTRTFATVTPCFVATAAYGTPMAKQVSALRRLRDRQLLTNAPGRALVKTYYERGSALARPLLTHAWLRGLSRALLWPAVRLARALEDAK